MEFVYDFLNNLLQKNDTLVVSVSGGPGSMCLLHVLKNYQQKLNLKIICAHVNHHTRCENEKEAEFVKNYCAKNNIIFEYLEIKKYPHNKFFIKTLKSCCFNKTSFFLIDTLPLGF